MLKTNLAKWFEICWAKHFSTCRSEDEKDGIFYLLGFKGLAFSSKNLWEFCQLLLKNQSLQVLYSAKM